MSLERSSASSSPPRRRHGLRLETIPLDSKSGQKFDSQFEKDDDFRFKRHHRSTGLGQRFDSLQDVKRAKRVENFNSSFGYNESQSQAHSQPHHLPYMYYYPMPHPAMAPAPMGPPQPPPSLPPAQPMAFQSPSTSMMPNSSLQPFYQETPQLLPPPNPYSYNFIQQESPRHRRRKERKLREEPEEEEEEEPRIIHSPNRDLPEEDFYRHIGDTSFGKSLQIRQLFNWCIIRALRNKESQPSAPTDGLDANRVALTIIKEFVNDLRNGNINIDWEAEESDSGGNENDNDDEDSELKELFADDGFMPSFKRKFKNNRSTMPNVKNVENHRNLADLESKIDSVRGQMQEWAQVLDSQHIDSEWSKIRRLPSPQEGMPLQEDNSSYKDLVQRIDKLKLHTHVLESHANALSELSNRKIESLSKDFVKVNHSRQIDARGLLKGLSNSLSK